MLQFEVFAAPKISCMQRLKARNFFKKLVTCIKHIFGTSNCKLSNVNSFLLNYFC